MTACAPMTAFQGYQAIDAKPADVKVGADTKNSVRARLGTPSQVSTFDPNQYRMLLFGLAMVLIMIWRPRGLVSTRTPSVFLRKRNDISVDLVKEGHG